MYYKIELIPLTDYVKEYYKEKLNENIDSNEIICYKNIVYEVIEDKILLGKCCSIGELPDDYEEIGIDEEIYYSYEITIPIFSIAQSAKFIILKGDILEYFKSNAEKYFEETEDLILLYNETNKSYHLTIGTKEEVKTYNNGIFSQYLLIDDDNFDIDRFKKLGTKDECVYMNNVIKKCNKIIEENIQIYDTYKDNNKCLECVKDSFKGNGNDKYDCLVKLAHYTIYYGISYISEIYYLLKRSQILEKVIKNKKYINISSLGCGFMPDLIAIDKYINDMWLKDIKIGYQGYDIEALWKEITLCPQCLEIKDLVNDNFDCTDIDIIFVNKLFSTLKRNELHMDFLCNFKNQLEDLPIGSFIVYNDVNNVNEGRDIFNKCITNRSYELVQKFKTEDGFNDNYMELNMQFICDFPTALHISSKDYQNKTVFFVYKKVQ